MDQQNSAGPFFTVGPVPSDPSKVLGPCNTEQSRVTFCCDTNISLFLRPELVDNATKCTGVEHVLFNGKFIANRCLSRGRWKYIYFCPWLYYCQGISSTWMGNVVYSASHTSISTDRNTLGDR